MQVSGTDWNMLKFHKLLLDKRRWPLGRRSLKLFACVFVQTPSPFGYSLLSKRESCLQLF